MPATRAIKRRIRTAKNISQVTHALEMVSAVKMRKAQLRALAGRVYIDELEKMLRLLAGKREVIDRPYLTLPKVINNVTVLIIGPQKGLAGALVTNLTRSVLKFLEEGSKRKDISSLLYYSDGQAPVSTIDISVAKITLVSLGKKGRDITRYAKKETLAEFGDLGKQPTIGNVRPVADFLVDLFLSGKSQIVFVAYSHFVNTVSQRPVVRQFLPILPANSQRDQSLAGEQDKGILFEPSAGEVLDSLFVRYCEAFLYQLVLESQASEHSARMVAMKNAHDNAVDIISELTLNYNKARQNTITSELADIVSSSLGVT